MGEEEEEEGGDEGLIGREREEAMEESKAGRTIRPKRRSLKDSCFIFFIIFFSPLVILHTPHGSPQCNGAWPGAEPTH